MGGGGLPRIASRSLSQLQCGTADTKIEVPFFENPEPTNVLPLNRGIGWNIAMHALPTASKVGHSI